MTIQDSIIEIIAEVKHLSPSSINVSDRIVEDLGAQSLDLLDIVEGIEKRHGIHLSEEWLAASDKIPPHGEFTVEALVEEVSKLI